MKTLYLDWSGDAGFKFRRGSSRYLTFACVTSETPFSEALTELRRRYSLGQVFHFRFTDASMFIKPSFFAAVGATNFSGIVLRLDKTRLGSELGRVRGNNLLALCAAETVSRMPMSAAENHALVYDGLRAERPLWQAMRVAVSAMLRRKGLTPIKRLLARPARQEDGLQVADMLAGAAASEHLADNALLGALGSKVLLVDYLGGEIKRPG